MIDTKMLKSLVPVKYEEHFSHIFVNRHIFHYQILRKMLRKRLIVIVGTAHRVGSTWLYMLLRDTYRLQTLVLPKRIIQGESTRQGVDIDITRLIDYFKELNGFFIFKSHSFPMSKSLPPDFANTIKFVTIVRDPRDVVVSASFYLANLDVKQGGLGEGFKRLSEVDRILGVIRDGDFLISRLEKWYESRSAHKVRYENLQNNTTDALRGIANYLGVGFKLRAAERAIDKNSFERKSGRLPGNEDKGEFLRKGITGDWKNYFDQKCISAFKTARDGQWNRLLIKMGYEENPNW
jgi:hypothetical protein